MSAAQDAFYIFSMVLTVLYLVGLVWFINAYGKRYVDTGKRYRDWSWKELLPGSAGRRARVERKHLVLMGPHYKRKEVKVKRKLIPYNLNKMLKR